MQNRRYILEPYSEQKSRYHCPKCHNRKKTFARYIDTVTGQYVSDIVGRCNRQNNCGYHYTPSQYFKENKPLLSLYPKATTKQRQETQYQQGLTRENSQRCSVDFPIYSQKSNDNNLTPSFIDKDIFQSSLTGYNRNIFTQFLTGLFGNETTSELIERYKIGTSKHWNGASIFYQIDINQNIRRGKVMLYDETGHRIKEPFSHITSVHSLLGKADQKPNECLFGEHLLKDNTLPVAIVESEKTACIASIYLPQFVWLACGQLQGLNADKCKVLAGRTVLLFPDLKGFDKWQQKAKELQSLLPDVRFAVSDYLERNATDADKAKGLDLADYLIQFEVKDFRQVVPAKPVWLSDAVNVTHKCKVGELSQDSYIDYLMSVCKYNDMTIDEYVSRVNEYEF